MDIEMLVGMGFSFLMVVTVLLFIGGMVLLRPIMKNLGNYLEAKGDEKRELGNPSPEQWERLLASLESMDEKIRLLEERQDFTERLLGDPDGRGGE